MQTPDTEDPKKIAWRHEKLSIDLFLLLPKPIEM